MPVSSFDIAQDNWTSSRPVWVTANKVDEGTTVPEADFDTNVGADWGNAHDDALFQVNEVFRGSRQIDSLDVENTLTVDDTIVIGDGSGSPELTLNKTDTGTANIELEVGGTRRWIVQMEDDEDLAVNRYDSGGLFQDNLRIQASTGRLDLPSDLLMDLPSATIDLGDGTGNPEIATSKGAGGQTTLNFYHGGTSATADAKQLLHDTDETLSIRHYNGTTWETLLKVLNDGEIVVNANAGVFRPETSAAADLGSTATEWDNVYQNVALLTDGITAPGTVSGYAQIFVDSADGDLKVKFGDGTTKTLATDT